MNMQELIEQECEALKDFLLAKNRAYGNSAAEPVRIFSKADPLEQINIRIDDKLSRIAKGNEYQGDDTELDLIGYLVLKRAVRRKIQWDKEDALIGPFIGPTPAGAKGGSLSPPGTDLTKPTSGGRFA